MSTFIPMKLPKCNGDRQTDKKCVEKRLKKNFKIQSYILNAAETIMFPRKRS